MKTYRPGDIATALGVSISSIRNWTAQAELQEFLSEIAKREGSYTNAKQREYTQQDLYVLNTVARQKTRFNDWEDIAEYLRGGELDTELPVSSALVQPMTMAEGFADAIMVRHEIDTLKMLLADIKAENETLQEQLEEEREKARIREELVREKAQLREDEIREKARIHEHELRDKYEAEKLELNLKLKTLEFQLNQLQNKHDDRKR